MVIEGGPPDGVLLKRIQDFLADNGLRYDQGIEYTVCVTDSAGNIIGTGSVEENVIKCVAVDFAHQGEGLSNLIVTNLISYEVERGRSHLFIYTKPINEGLFSDLGFYTVLKTNEILFMENWKDGFTRFLEKMKRETLREARGEGLRIGAVVANCNPFTRGHRYLLECAVKKCDYLHLFILEDPRSLFSPEERCQMALNGCRDLKQVMVHKGSEYIVSSSTFPSYFMKNKEDSEQANCRLDLELFAKKIAPELQIGIRFVGTEPSCKVTGLYNRMMKDVLPLYGIRVEETERLRIEGRPVSASFVRESILSGRAEAIRELVPESTWKYVEKKIERGVGALF